MINLFLWNSIGNYLLFGSNIIFRIIFSRFLPADVFGKYTFALSIVDLFLVVNLFRFTVCIIQFPNEKGLETIVKKFVRWQLVISLIIGCLIIIYLFLKNYESSIIVFVFFYLISSIINIEKSYYQALIERNLLYKQYGKILLTSSVLALIVVLCLYFLSNTNYIFGIKDLIISILTYYGFYFYGKKLEMVNSTFYDYRNVLKIGIFVMIQAQTINMLNKLDIFFIGLNCTPDFLGYYSQARFLTQNITNLSFMFFQPLFSIYSNMEANYKEISYKYFAAISSVISFVLTVVILLIYFTSEYLILILFGNKWLDINNLFRSFVFLIYPNLLISNLSLYLHAKGSLKVTTVLSTMVALSYVILLLIFSKENSHIEKIIIYYLVNFVMLAGLFILVKIKIFETIFIFAPIIILMPVFFNSSTVWILTFLLSLCLIYIYKRIGYLSLVSLKINNG